MASQLALLEKLSTSTNFDNTTIEDLKTMGFSEELATAIQEKNSTKITELLGANNNVSVILAIGDDDRVNEVTSYQKTA